ncbi:hypothetical protein TNIN_415161 [Trichonephila inaurata madagascariensis]|uniref:Uncharacterized protein n=1 Tax=Trichonephila inaurata madagascariensis TaxID=2747483 RepID=A0A8X6IUQ9_9ARAC|nr:hypothetical protein TNIN_357671 [Trichonephila inaurata madagascariensis]GFY63954.1 hypothetical protein TNIN_415161 [Trichonephila inaurata madagascariensis]
MSRLCAWNAKRLFTECYPMRISAELLSDCWLGNRGFLTFSRYLGTSRVLRGEAVLPMWSFFCVFYAVVLVKTNINAVTLIGERIKCDMRGRYLVGNNRSVFQYRNKIIFSYFP